MFINLWCDSCRTIVPAAAAYHRPADDRFPWLDYVPATDPLWLCTRCQCRHLDLAPYTVTAPQPH